MSPLDIGLCLLVGVIAGGINAVAGGGSLVSFPFLHFGLGLSSPVANATNALGLWPGSIGGAMGYINLLERTKGTLIKLAVPTLIGGCLGAWLFTVTPISIFDQVVPFLILFAAVLLGLQPQIKKWSSRGERQVSMLTGLLMQFLVALYGGYFGAGMGIMMLAAFALYVEGTIHELNAMKNWLGVMINLSASVTFLIKGLVNWPVALVFAVGTVAGGFFAARVSQKIHPDRLRTAVAVFGIAMAVYYFVRTQNG
jgi:uncharacterized membrane protein YfcA